MNPSRGTEEWNAYVMRTKLEGGGGGVGVRWSVLIFWLGTFNWLKLNDMDRIRQISGCHFLFMIISHKQTDFPSVSFGTIGHHGNIIVIIETPGQDYMFVIFQYDVTDWTDGPQTPDPLSWICSAWMKAWR